MEYSLWYYLFDLVLRGMCMYFLMQHYLHPGPELTGCRRLECMSEICADTLDDNSSLEERRNKFEEIKLKYADLD